MYFNKMLRVGESAYEDLDPTKHSGAFVELGYTGGSLNESRAIW